MTQSYGIDTSVLVRLVTATPEPDFQRSVNRLRVLIEEDDAEVFASNQVIGEAYIVLQYHYGTSAADARAALADTLKSGLVAPLNGRSVILSLQSSDGPGLFDRLIANGYSGAGLETLTLDRQMATLPGVRRM